MPKKNWMRRLADEIELDSEPIPGVSVVELAGDNRVIVERHSGIIEYSCDRIGLKVPFGCVYICGCGLHILKMTKEHLVISGRIDTVMLRRRCG